MALLYARQRAQVQQSRSTSAIPERNCRLIINGGDALDFSQPKITGKLCINNLCTENIPIAGIFVRLEINELVKVDTRFDGRAETKVNMENILASENWATVYVLGEDSTVCKLNIPSRRSEYTFTFDLTESKIKQFPASYKSANGYITYQIVAYIQRPYPDDKVYYQRLIGSNTVDNPGYFNLSLDPASSNLISSEKSLQKSFFSKRNAFKATLMVNKTGFLPGEDIPFTVSTNNITGETVTKSTLSLVRRIIWKTSTDSKNLVAVLDSKNNREIGQGIDENWSDILHIPNSIGPTAGGAIEFQYVLRLEILLSERVPFKSETIILIGTTWGDPRTDSAIRNPEKFSLRQSSFESTASGFSFPPNYSALSSRKASFETLPPGYEDAIDSGIENLELGSPTEEEEPK